MTDDFLNKDNALQPEQESSGVPSENEVRQNTPEDNTQAAAESSVPTDDGAASRERVTEDWTVSTEDWTVPAEETVPPVSPGKKKGTTIAAIILAVLIVGVIALLIFRVAGKLGGENETDGTTEANTSVSGGDVTREYTIEDYSITKSGDGALQQSNGENEATAPESQTHVEVANGTIVVSSVQRVNGSDETVIVYNTVPVPGEPTGTNRISDEATNKFIQVVANEKSVDPSLLVAIYPENFDGTESDDNFVLQFDGTKDSNGNLIRSPETLEIVYKVDSQRNIIVNRKVGVAGQLVFAMVTELIMPQHPDYFTGVE